MKAGDIYHLDLDPTKGHEQRGKRYVLIISSEGYNQGHAYADCRSHHGRRRVCKDCRLYRVAHRMQPYDKRVVRLDQIRSLDLKARGGKRIESIPNAVLEDVLNRVMAIFEHE